MRKHGNNAVLRKLWVDKFLSELLRDRKVTGHTDWMKSSRGKNYKPGNGVTK